jgi:hypothetical protein
VATAVDPVLEIEVAVSPRPGDGGLETVVDVELRFQGRGIEGHLQVEPGVDQAAGNTAAGDRGLEIVSEVATVKPM